MDYIFINHLTAHAIIGIYDRERLAPQPITLHLTLAADIAAAADADVINQTVCYETVANRVTALIESTHYQLVETLAEQIAGFIREEFDVRWLRLELHKPEALPGLTDVGVIIERGQRPDGQTPPFSQR